MSALINLIAENSLVHQIGNIFQPLLKLVASILAFFFAVIPNYPIDVALLTIVIMALLTPLTVKSTKNMAAMQALSPEMKKLQQKYKGDRTQLNEEMMKLYKEHNVNPASGCLPMLLQMPAFFILYSVIRGITNTVAKGAHIPYGSGICHQTVCAEPRYLSQSSKMYQHIVAAHGQLISFGLNFADKLLSHHSTIWVAIPYVLLVLGAVGLQYLQMSRLNARNPQAAQANPQAAMMQKYMPLIFGLIYLNVAAILNVYFIFSSGIRILTQEVLFRKGIVAGSAATIAGKPQGGQAQREKALPKAGGTSPSRAKTRDQPSAASADGEVSTNATTNGRQERARANGSNGSGGTNGKRPQQGSRPRSGGSGAGSNGGQRRARSGSAPPANEEPVAKPHPRSKAKRARKAR